MRFQDLDIHSAQVAIHTSSLLEEADQERLARRGRASGTASWQLRPRSKAAVRTRAPSARRRDPRRPECVRVGATLRPPRERVGLSQGRLKSANHLAWPDADSDELTELRAYCSPDLSPG